MIATIERDRVLTAEDRAELKTAFDKISKAFEGEFEKYGVMSPDDMPAFLEPIRQEYYEERLAERRAYKAKKEAENARFAR